MKNKEFLNYMLVTDKDLSKENHLSDYEYYIHYISNREFEIKDIYLGLKKVGLDILSILKICMLLCIHFNRKEVDKDLIKRLVVNGAEFRLRHLATKDNYYEDVKEDLIASIMNSNDIKELEKRLRKIQNTKSIKLDDTIYYTQCSKGISDKIAINLKSLSDKKSNEYIILGNVFDMISNGRIIYQDILGIGFIGERYILLREDYRDKNLFDYIAYR